MVKSVQNTPDMRGKKNKNKRPAASKEVNVSSKSDGSKRNDTRSSVNSKVNQSQKLNCIVCGEIKNGRVWFVQCDQCDEHFHFECVGFMESDAEAPWSCDECQRKKDETNTSSQVIESNDDQDSHVDTSPNLSLSNQLSNNDNTTSMSKQSKSNQNPSALVVQADVNVQPKPIDHQLDKVIVSESDSNQLWIDATNAFDQRNRGQLSLRPNQPVSREFLKAELEKMPDDVDAIKPYDDSRKSPHNMSASQHLGDRQTSTRAASIKPRSKTSLSKSSTSSQRSVNLERVQAELDLQTQLDEETLALKLEAVKLKEEAVKLKEARMRKFIDDKYKAAGSQSGSVRSHYTNDSNRTSYVSSWIEDQRKQAKSRSVEDYMLQETANKGKSVDDIQRPAKAKSVDDDRGIKKTIDEFKFDWSVTLEADERTMLTELLRKSALAKSQMNPDKDIDESGKDCGKLKASALTFVPYSLVDKESKKEPPQSNALRSQDTMPDPTHHSAVPKGNPSHLNTVSQMTNPSLALYTHNNMNYPPIVPSQRNSTKTCQSQVGHSDQRYSWYDPSFNNQRPIASTLIPKYQPITQPQFGQFANQSQSKSNATYCKGPPIDLTFSSNHLYNYQNTSTIASGHPATVQHSTFQSQSAPAFEHVVSLPISSMNQVYTSTNRNQPVNTQVVLSSSNGNTYNAVPTSEMQYFRPFQAPTLTTNQIAARHAMGRDHLPKFYGNPAEWLRFISRYENSTGNCGFSNEENLDRLDKCILGKAREIVECLLTIPECVPEIIDTLREKYGRPEIIIKALLEEIRSEPSIKPDKLEVLSNYGFKVRNVYKTIKSLGILYHLYNPELIQELIEKLPHQTKIDWARHSESLLQISLIDLSDWLYKLSKSINRIIIPEITTPSKEKSKKEGSKSETPKNGYVNVHDNKASQEVKDNQNSTDKICLICGSNCKFVGECPKFKGLTIEERWKSVKENKICGKCLWRHRGSCRKSKECGVNSCTAKHHSLMHNSNRNPKGSPSSSSQSVAIKGTNPSVVTQVVTGSSNTHYDDNPSTLFRIVPVVVSNNNKSFSTFAFLDEGSSFTLMERHVANQIGLRGTPEMICLLWTNKVHRQEQSELANLEISGVNVEPIKRYPMRSVNIVNDLGLPTQSLNPIKMVQRFPHLKDLPLVEYKNATPTIIIGLKHARLSTPLEMIEGGENDPIVTRSRLGWAVHGPVDHTSIGKVNVHRVSTCLCHDRDDNLHNMVKEHFSVENFGVTASSMSLESKEDEQALELLKKFTLRKGNRFETRLLWKNEACELPDSYPMAIKRLLCLENKGSQVISTINDFIKDYIEKGYVSKLSPNVISKRHSRTWYLPIFTVVHPKKPKKLRPVFDGAARVKGVSLNSALYTGPDLLVSIVEVLRRFREHKVAICGDIKEMYHQVFVHEDDRHSQRFLWRNGEKSRDPDVYVMNVMTFGATCSPSAAQYVKNINASEFQSKFPRAAEAIIKNHYVDDLMDGADSVKEATQLVNDVKFIHSQGGFEIRNFKSNSEELLKAIGEPVNVDEKVSVENESMVERVLGMFWYTRLDCFTFSLKFTKVSAEISNGKKLPTKREALRLLMSIFDPLGLLSYYLIHLKILIQDVWRSQAKWDDQIPENLHDKWIRWVEILPNVTKLKIPRCYSINLSEKISKKVELHVFVDAGEDAFAAVAYIKIETKESCECTLVGSKARVAPLKYLSIPRKELQAAVLGTRLLSSIVANQSFKVDRRIIWSDSETVLSWLKSNSRKYSQFVGHRVGEILENTDLHEWRWVSTKENVADEATKWSKTPTFNAYDRWFKGPEFIQKSEDQWPEKKNVKSDVKEEMKAHFAHVKFVVPHVINPENFSRWDRMVRSLAYAIWFVTTRRTQKETSLSPEEISKAENLIFRQAQFEGYPSEMVTLERNKTLPIDKYEFIEKPSPLYDGSPYIDGNGVLRMKWRIDGARELSYDTRRPIILPSTGRITMLLVHSYHVKFFHQNHETVFNEIRQRFYIPRLRTVIKKVRKNCQMCKVKLAKIMEPQMADLPFARVATHFRAFSFVGVDYFGPMYVTIGKRKEKRWGVLFTCLTIRAIHIELANSLDTNECILCVRNHITTHGIPIEIHSDNGSNFRGADNELQREKKKIDHEKLSEKFTDSYTKWIFTAPKAAHMGGSWEVLIRSVKSGLKEIMPTRTPKENMLRNLLKEISNVVNSRPLTYIPLECDEDEALTPNHFLLGSSNGYKPPCKIDLDGPYLRQSWKESQRLTELFWKRFIREYLPTITRRTKWFKPMKPLEPGNLVLIVDPENPRNTYPRARVLEVRTGSNGQVRRVKLDTILEVKTNAKGKICEVRRNELWRPAHKLAVLDVAPEDSLAQPQLDQPQLNQPLVDRKTGGSVGASDLNQNSDAVVDRHGTNPLSNRVLRSSSKAVNA